MCGWATGDPADNVAAPAAEVLSNAQYRWLSSMWWSEEVRDRMRDRILLERAFREAHRQFSIQHETKKAEEIYNKYMEDRTQRDPATLKKSNRPPPKHPQAVKEQLELDWANRAQSNDDAFPLGAYCDLLKPFPDCH